MNTTKNNKEQQNNTQSKGPNFFIRLILKMGGYWFFAFLQVLRLPHCFMKKRAGANREINQSKKLKFPLNGQGVGELKDLRIGHCSFAHSGCGAIATYNVLAMMGREPEMTEIVDFYERKGLIWYAYFGINPIAVGKYLTKQGLRWKRYSGKKNWDACLQDGQSAILMYWWAGAKSCGAHYVALNKTEQDVVVYNKSNAANREGTYQDIETFLNKGTYKRGIVMYVVDKEVS